jgi:hypothetical protein
MTYRFGTLLLAVNLGVGGMAAAAEPVPQCPATLDVTQSVSAVPPGFQPYVDGNPPSEAGSKPISVPLRDVMVSDGSPVDQVWLAPTRTNKTSLDWDFSSSDHKDLWISCAYLGTSIIISAKLPQSVARCQVFLGEDHRTAQTVRCR